MIRLLILNVISKLIHTSQALADINNYMLLNYIINLSNLCSNDIVQFSDTFKYALFADDTNILYYCKRTKISFMVSVRQNFK